MKKLYCCKPKCNIIYKDDNLRGCCEECYNNNENLKTYYKNTLYVFHTLLKNDIIKVLRCSVCRLRLYKLRPYEYCNTCIDIAAILEDQ